MTPQQEQQELQLLFDYIGRHLIAIGGVYSDVNQFGVIQPAQEGVCFSGFLVEVDGDWYAITAGHILGENFGDAIANNMRHIHDCKFYNHGKDAIADKPTPFDWYSIRKYHMFDMAQGLDHGVFRLEPPHVESLIANGAIALSEQNWIDGDATDAEDFLIIGFPTEEQTREEHGDITTHFARSCIAGATPCPRPTNITPATTTFPQFVAKLNSHEPTDMDGFSGSPIFRYRSVAENGKRQYWLHAIQSAWLPHERITFGCPMTVVTQHIRANSRWS